MTIYPCFVLCLIWSHLLCAAVVVRVSETGSDISSCWGSSNAIMPCKTIGYAMNSIWNAKHVNEIVFTFLIEDQVYSLEERVEIIQTNAGKGVYLRSRNRTVVNCTNAFAGIDVGTRKGKDSNSNRTRNIFFESLEFQNCGPDLAAVVRIWNSVDIQFTNCVFRRNKQSGINAFDSGVTIENCRFVNNTPNVNTSSENYTTGVSSIGGGAGFEFANATNLSLIIRHSIFESNSAGDLRHLDIIPSFHIPPELRRYFGGGLFVAFTEIAESCQVEIFNGTFSNNTALAGGGIFLKQSGKALRNHFNVTSSNFTANYALETSGGFAISDTAEVPSFNCVFKNCIVSENTSKRRPGMSVSVTNLRSTNGSTIRFDTITFSNNHGSKDAVILIATILPYKGTDVTPEFINCIIKDNKISGSLSFSTLTSFKVNLKFVGSNVFQQNHGGGAAAFYNCVVSVHGKLTFSNNSGTNGGALFIGESQIKLFPGSEVMFWGNEASGVGGAICVYEAIEDDFIHVNNPLCFLAYSDPLVPPSKWKINVSFIENRSKLMGAAIFSSSIRRCMWNEERPHHNPHKALRWSSNFVYRNNFLISGEKDPGVNGSKIDIATGTYSYQSNAKNGSTLKLMPGEYYPLSLQAIDELGQKGIAIVIASEIDKVNSTGSILLDDISYLLFPKRTVIPFSFQVPEKTYNESVQKEKVKRNIKFVDPFSVLTNSHSFYLEIQPCYPGFIFARNLKRCVCDTNLEAIQRCDNSAVYLKEGYWANISDAGHLVTYSCPLNYCNCTRKPGLPGCLFDPENSNGQCAENREGWMCGKCKGNTSVGLRLSKCIECETSGWMLGVVTAIVIGLCVFIIWLNPGISSELRGPLFFFQVLPFIVDTTSTLGEYVSWAADIFNFGGPFIYLIKNTCILQGISNLPALAFGYIIPVSVLFVFLLAYFLSTKYYLTFKLRRHSMLPSFWLLLVFVYNYLVSTSFLILFCAKVGGKYVFFYDGTITCFHGNHLPMGIIAIMVLVFMVIPPPVVVILITNGFWRLGPQYMDTLSISLRPKFRWWWSVDLARRVLVVALFALVPDGQIKKFLMIVLCIVILAVHSNCHPYVRWRANITESTYLLVLSMLAVMQYVEYESNIAPGAVLSPGGKAGKKPWERRWFETPYEKTSVVLLVIVSIHTVGAFFYKAACFCSSFHCHSSVTCCARAQVTLDRSGYQEIENTSSDQSVDAETERRREIMDIIFKTRPQTQLET